MSRDSVTNAVRQVLMNELGLTRESVRAEVDKIVREVVEARVSAALVERTVDDAVAAAMAKRAGEWHRQDFMRESFRRAAAEAVARIVEERLKVSWAEPTR